MSDTLIEQLQRELPFEEDVFIVSSFARVEVYLIAVENADVVPRVRIETDFYERLFRRFDLR